MAVALPWFCWLTLLTTGSLSWVTAQPEVIPSDVGKQTYDLCLPRVSELSDGAEFRQNNVAGPGGKVLTIVGICKAGS